MNVREYKVDVANIVANPKYQRPLNEAWVRKIVKNFDESKINQLVLSVTPEGKYFAIDGQHTIEAVRQVKGEHYPLSAKVFSGLTEKEEADLFYSYNTDRKALTSNDKIRARLACGDQDIVDYFDALDETGVPYRLSTAHGGTASFLANHSMTSRVFGVVGMAAGTRGMWVYKLAGYKNSPAVLAGLMLLISRHPEINDKRLTKKLAAVSAEELKRESYSVGSASGYAMGSVAIDKGGRVSVSARIMARTIAVYYNKGAKKSGIDIMTI